MKRVLLVLILAAATLSPAAVGNPPMSVNGGGRGTLNGTTPFSQFGFQVSKAADGSVHGHFNCLMAGSSQFPGFTLMAVRGQVTSLSISAGTATFEGSGMLQTGNQGKVATATFRVVVTGGGPGAGTLQLTLLTPPVMPPLPTERVLEGHITVD